MPIAFHQRDGTTIMMHEPCNLGVVMSKRKPRTPFLITGCQRSGTTLMGLVLDSHPEIWSIDEDKFLLPEIYRYLYGPAQLATPFVTFKLPEYAHLLPFIDALPDGRTLWCIRNPLDTVWSMVKLNWSMGGITAPWAIHPSGGWAEISRCYWVLSDEQKEELTDHMARFSTLTKTLMKLMQSPDELAAIDRQDCVFIGALCWRIKNELPRQYMARNIDFHVIRYEDLVTNPKDRIAQILNYMGVEWREEVLMHHRLHDGMSIGNTSNTRAIDQKSLGEGKVNLVQEGQDLIKTICGDTALRWNFDFN